MFLTSAPAQHCSKFLDAMRTSAGQGKSNFPHVFGCLLMSRCTISVYSCDFPIVMLKVQLWSGRYHRTWRKLFRRHLKLDERAMRITFLSLSGVRTETRLKQNIYSARRKGSEIPFMWHIRALVWYQSGLNLNNNAHAQPGEPTAALELDFSDHRSNIVGI